MNLLIGQIMKTNIENVLGRVADEFINNHQGKRVEEIHKVIDKVNRKGM